MGEIVQILCDGCGATEQYFLGFGMLGSESQLARCRSCADLVVVERDARADEPFDDRCQSCGGTVERPYPATWERSAGEDDIAPAACPKCGGSLHRQFVGMWD